MVMELMEGSDLFCRIISKKKYSEEDGKKLIWNMFSGVQHLHEMKIIHRDLKPENILLVSEDDDVTCKVADFGLSRLFPENEEKQSTGTLCGSPGYVAPEVLECVPYSYPVDLWSLGVITYTALCGFPPFQLEMTFESIKKVKSADFCFNSPELKDFISMIIIADPLKRATFEECLTHLG